MNSQAPRILVIGSINMDLVVRSARLPRPGETLTGVCLTEIPGGKGASQAVAAARLGGRIHMCGRLGCDGFGHALRRSLVENDVDVRHVSDTERVSSGVAVIGVEDSGQNCITVVPGANGCVTPADVAAVESVLKDCRVLLLQLEIPQDAVLAAIRLAQQHQVLTILDPAPAPDRLADGLLNVDVVCPNESEASAITGISVTDLPSAYAAAEALHKLGAARVLITLGAQGAAYRDADGGIGHVPAPPVDVVDTTAAGDAFAAALGLALAEGRSFAEAVRFACAAGSAAASKPGAQPGMPQRNTVDELLRRQ
ncbi:MAG: ribokinase [Planctomycetaceae bacterium]|nr:ribokinase [Planctomycetaceae bacterium]